MNFVSLSMSLCLFLSLFSLVFGFLPGMFASYPLIQAVHDGNEAEVDRLVKRGIDVNARTSSKQYAADGFTALHVLCNGRRTDPVFQRIMAKLLFCKGVDLNAFNALGDTPLITAAYYGTHVTLVFTCISSRWRILCTCIVYVIFCMFRSTGSVPTYFAVCQDSWRKRPLYHHDEPGLNREHTSQSNCAAVGCYQAAY